MHIYFLIQKGMLMSIWMALLVAPQETRLLARDQFAELLHDLLQREIVQMPCALLSGHVDADSPLGIANLFIHHRYINGEWVTFPLDFPPGTNLHQKDGSVTIHYCGERVEELLKAVSSAPYGTRDLCVWFECLNFDNEEVRSTGSYNADVVVYALAQPQEVFYEVEIEAEVNEDDMEEDEYSDTVMQMHVHTVQSCFRTTGSSGPYKTCTPMDTIFKRYFGNDFIVGCFYS
jgi:hypothetical protein